MCTSHPDENSNKVIMIIVTVAITQIISTIRLRATRNIRGWSEGEGTGQKGWKSETLSVSGQEEMGDKSSLP